MSTFDPVISPWLATCSCVGFTVLFVGSLYIFPVKGKLPREHARHTLLASLSQSPPILASASALAVVAAAAGTSSKSAVDTPTSSPRASSSSFVSSTSFINSGATTATASTSTTINNSSSTSTTSTTTSAIIMTKSPATGGVADNRAHRSSTHLQFIDTPNSDNIQSGSGSTGSLIVSPSLSALAAANSSNPNNSTSAALLSSTSTSTSSFSISESSTTARPEVATHSYSSHSPYDPFQSRHQRPTPSQRATQSPSSDSQKLDRNHPLVILQRFKGLMLTCLVVPFYLWWLFKLTGAIPADLSFWTRLGYFLSLLGISFPENIFLLANHIVIPLVLVGILFMGPVFMMFLSNELPFQQTFDWRIHYRYMQGLTGMRNLVVGPISEEFIFRACMVAVVAYSGASFYAIIFALPLVFGIAHVHHGYETYLKKGATRRALLNALLMSFFQFAYTTLFGWFTTFLFLRTSNLIGPCLCHTFCNMMGAPDVTNIQYFGRWKNWLYLAFVTGAVLFAVLLKPLTSPELYGSEASSAYWAIVSGSSSSSSQSSGPLS